MHKVHRRGSTWIVMLLAALALIGGACGGTGTTDTTEAATPDTTAAPATTVATTPETTAATTPDTTAAPEAKGTIGFSYGNESAGIYPIVAKPAAIEAERLGYGWVEGAANGDCDKQVQDIEGMIAQGVSAIVFLPLCGVEPYAGVVEQAKAAGIVVVGYSTAVPGGDAAVVYDNVSGGELIARDAIRWFNEEFTGDKENFTWALFTFDQCGRACTDRTDTIRDIIVAELGIEPLEAEAVAEDTGLEATETFLQGTPTLNMVLGINDGGALGAYQAFVNQIEQEGRDPGEIYVGGMDGQNEALELIAEGGGPHGIYRSSSALILDQLGKAVADLPINILEGQPTNSLLLNYELVTPANPDRAQEILDNYASFTG